MQMAIPPMLPTCMSVTTRSGGASSTTLRTSSPEYTSRTSVSLSSRADLTSAMTVGASLTTRISNTVGGYPADDIVGDEGQTGEVVNIVTQVRHLDDRSFYAALELPEVPPFLSDHVLELLEVAP